MRIIASEQTRPSLRVTAILVVAVFGVVVGIVLGLGIVSAEAGPCSREIERLAQAIREAKGNPNAGPSAKQTIGAQLDRQPTPGSIKRAEQQALASFDVALGRARRFDARDDRAGCTRALSHAKAMYDLQ